MIQELDIYHRASKDVGPEGVEMKHSLWACENLSLTYAFRQWLTSSEDSNRGLNTSFTILNLGNISRNYKSKGRAKEPRHAGDFTEAVLSSSNQRQISTSFSILIRHMLQKNQNPTNKINKTKWIKSIQNVHFKCLLTLPIPDDAPVIRTTFPATSSLKIDRNTNERNLKNR